MTIDNQTGNAIIAALCEAADEWESAAGYCHEDEEIESLNAKAANARELADKLVKLYVADTREV